MLSFDYFQQNEKSLKNPPTVTHTFKVTETLNFDYAVPAPLIQVPISGTELDYKNVIETDYYVPKTLSDAEICQSELMDLWQYVNTQTNMLNDMIDLVTILTLQKNPNQINCLNELKECMLKEEEGLECELREIDKDVQIESLQAQLAQREQEYAELYAGFEACKKDYISLLNQ